MAKTFLLWDGEGKELLEFDSKKDLQNSVEDFNEAELATLRFFRATELFPKVKSQIRLDKGE